MSQELEQEEKKEEEREKKKISRFEPRTDLQNPKLRKRVVELRNQRVSYPDIVTQIKKDFNVSMSQPTAKNIFEKEIAVTVTTKPMARDQFSADYSKMHERYQRAANWIDTIGDIIEKLREKVQSGELNEVALLKVAPIIQTNAREVTNQLRFLIEQMDRITIQQKNLIMSPIEIMNRVNQQIKRLQEEGYIKILKKLPHEEEEDDSPGDI